MAKAVGTEGPRVGAAHRFLVHYLAISNTIVYKAVDIFLLYSASITPQKQYADEKGIMDCLSVVAAVKYGLVESINNNAHFSCLRQQWMEVRLRNILQRI